MSFLMIVLVGLVYGANTELVSATTAWAVARDLSVTTVTTQVDIPAHLGSVRVTCEDVACAVAPTGTDGGALAANHLKIASGESATIHSTKTRSAWSIYVAGQAGPVNFSVDTVR